MSFTEYLPCKTRDKIRGSRGKSCRNSRLKRARGHELRDEDDALVTLHGRLPGVMEANDVRVLEAF